MKKIFFFLALAIGTLSLVQSCDCDPCSKTKKVMPTGVIKFDSLGNEPIGVYDWSLVDTITGFTTFPVGFDVYISSDSKQPLVDTKQNRWINTMLAAFQIRFKVKVTDYHYFYPYDGSGVLKLIVFYEPAINPQLQNLLDANKRLQGQNDTLRSTVNNLIIGNWQIWNEIKTLKKSIEEKK
jgi:hypothetical protein